MKCEGQILPIMIIISHLDHDTPLLQRGHRRRPQEQQAQRCACIIFLFTDADMAASGRAQTPSDVAARGGFNTLPIRFRWVSTQTGRGRSLSYVLLMRTRPLLSHFDLFITTPAVHLHFDTGWWGNPSLPAVYLHFRWDDLPPRRLPLFKVG